MDAVRGVCAVGLQGLRLPPLSGGPCGRSAGTAKRAKISLSTHTFFNKNFLGWYTSKTDGVRITESSEVQRENNELYAHWSPITYTVRFNANGGSGYVADQQHTYNVSKALAAVGFSNGSLAFVGWAASATGEVVYANKAVVENLAEIEGAVVTLYAVWGSGTYAVRFDSHGGAGLMDNQTFVIGAAQALSVCAYTRAGSRRFRSQWRRRGRRRSPVCWRTAQR